MKMVDDEDMTEEEIGFLLWQLSEFESFYPIYKSLIKND